MPSVRILIDFKSFSEIVSTVAGILNDIENKLSEAPDSGDDMADILEGLLDELADYDPNRDGHYQHAPEYGERAWRIPGRRLSIVVWDNGNGYYEPLGVEVLADVGVLRLGLRLAEPR